MSAPLRLVVNGSVREYGDAGPATLLELAESMGLAKSRLVAELNGEIIRQDNFHLQPLATGDKVELVKFVGGG